MFTNDPNTAIIVTNAIALAGLIALAAVVAVWQRDAKPIEDLTPYRIYLEIMPEQAWRGEEPKRTEYAFSTDAERQAFVRGLRAAQWSNGIYRWSEEPF